MSAKLPSLCKTTQAELLAEHRTDGTPRQRGDVCPYCPVLIAGHDNPQTTATATASSKKRPWSAPTALSGDKWTTRELDRYEVVVAPVESIGDLFGPDIISEANLPPLSADASSFLESCKDINFATINIPHFPPPELFVGHHVAKLVFLAEIHFSSYEGVVDDCVAAILHHMGFNRGPLVVLTKNLLSFTMTNQTKQATADVTVINVDTRFRLAVFEDKSAKRLDDVKLQPDAHEAQLVAEAIAAAMSNQSHPDELLKKKQKTRSQSAAESGPGSAAAGDASASVSARSELVVAPVGTAIEESTVGGYQQAAELKFSPDAVERLFLLRVMGNAWTFYFAELSGALLNAVATGQGPPPPTIIRRFMPSKAYLAQLAGEAPPPTAKAPAAAIYDNSKLRFIDPIERRTIIHLLDIILSQLRT